MTAKLGIEPKINEDLLYYVWTLKTFDHQNLQTTDRSKLDILQSGHRNHDSGPDFHQARIAIANQVWAGHIEMHVKSSDWLKHGHDRDPAFQNVVLHVVYENDREIRLPNGEPLPCLELKGRINKSIIENYTALLQAKTWIPCADNQRPISDLALSSWYERVLVERLARKTANINLELSKTENDWEEVFYRKLARNFGFKVNGEIFERLANSLPHRLLMKHKDKLHDLEALLLGQAGLLADVEDDYGKALRETYTFLSRKYDLTPLDRHLWKFMRLRPANFPTIRIAQFAILLFKSSHLFSKMLAAKNYREIAHLFSSDVSPYWKTHYAFDKPSPKRTKKLGASSIQLLVINTVVPFLFLYGYQQKNDKFKDKALRLLEEIKPEHNKITKGFVLLDFPCRSAFDSQALIELKHNYCDRKQCLSCAIGNSILKPSTES